MKKLFLYSVCLSFFLGIFILLNEFFTSVQILENLNKNNSFIPESSFTFQLAKSEKGFKKSQKKAYARRAKGVLPDLFKHIMFLFSSMLLLNRKIRKSLQSVISSAVEVFPKGNSQTKEIVYVSVVITALVASVFSSHPFPFKSNNSLFSTIWIYFFLSFIVIPFLYLAISKLLKVYSKRLIAACYLAYYVKSISEFMTVDDVNFSLMKRIDISEFSSTVVDYLKERKLENRVYAELKKSDSLNAALVGWGSLERIEIYGDHKDLTDREFESVLMHEIGHSQDFSLYKKLTVLFIVKFIEMVVVLYLFNTCSEKYADEFISKYAAFSILVVIYFFYMDRWLIFFHKLTSQTAENSADKIAKAHGYGNELSKVLFDITVKGETAIKSTWLFNAVRSYHPTVYERVEKLSS